MFRLRLLLLAVLLLPGIADSLAGRIEVLSLWPLSSAEMADSAESASFFTGRSG